MKKLLIILVIIFGIASDASARCCRRRGGALGVQFGRVTFGLGGSENGPIIGVGPSPDNGRSFSPVIVPGSRYDYSEPAATEIEEELYE